MRLRVLTAFFAVCLAAAGQTITIQQLVQFLQSSAEQIKEGKQSDKETADFLLRAKLSERLDDRAIEQIMGSVSVGPRTLAALRALRDKSAGLAAARPIVEP